MDRRLKRKYAFSQNNAGQQMAQHRDLAYLERQSSPTASSPQDNTGYIEEVKCHTPGHTDVVELTELAMSYCNLLSNGLSSEELVDKCRFEAFVLDSDLLLQKRRPEREIDEEGGETTQSQARRLQWDEFTRAMGRLESNMRVQYDEVRNSATYLSWKRPELFHGRLRLLHFDKQKTLDPVIGAVEGVDVTDPLRHPPFDAFPRPRFIMTPFGRKGEVDWTIYKGDETDEQMSEWKRVRGYKPRDASSVEEMAHPHLNATHVRLPSKTKDGLWLTLSSKQYIIDNFHIRCIDRYGLDVLENDNMLVPRSSSSSEILRERDACMVNVMDEVTGVTISVPGYVPKSSGKRTEHIYYIAHNRFGFLSHLNTLSLRFSKQGFSSRGLADERAFNDMIRNLHSTPFMEALVGLEQWQEGLFRLPPKPPDPPASVLYSSAQMKAYYAVLSEGHVKVVEVEATDYTEASEYEQLLGPLSDNSTDQEVSNAYRRLAKHYHPDRNDDPKDEFKMPIINDAKERVAEWRARPQGAGVGAAADRVAMVKIKMDRSNVRFYCDNKEYMCAHNRNDKKFKPQSGGLRHKYGPGGVDPYKNADTAPPVVCEECAKAGYPGMMMTRNVRKYK